MARNSRYAGTQSSAEEPDIMNDSPVTPGLMAKSEAIVPPIYGHDPVFAPTPQLEDDSPFGLTELSKPSPMCQPLASMGMLVSY